MNADGILAGNAAVGGGALAPGGAGGQHLRTADGHRQSVIHGDLDLHDPGLARQCKPHQRHGHRDARRRRWMRFPGRQRQFVIVNSKGALIGTFNPAVVSNMADLQST